MLSSPVVAGLAVLPSPVVTRPMTVPATPPGYAPVTPPFPHVSDSSSEEALLLPADFSSEKAKKDKKLDKKNKRDKKDKKDKRHKKHKTDKKDKNDKKDKQDKKDKHVKKDAKSKPAPNPKRRATVRSEKGVGGSV